MTLAPAPLWTCLHLFFLGSALFAAHAALPRRRQGEAAVLLMLATAVLALAERGTLLCVTAGFAALVLGAARLEAVLAVGAERLRWFGEATYGIYLWHIPVQLVLILALPAAQVMASPLALMLFIAGMIAIGYASFRWFETPARRWINGHALWQERPA